MLLIILTIIIIIILAGIIGIAYIGQNKTNGLNHDKKTSLIDTLKEKLKFNNQKNGKEKWKYKHK